MRGGAVVVVVGCPSSWNGGSGTLWSWLSWFPFLSSIFPPPFLPLSPHPSYPPSEQLLAVVVGGVRCGVDGVSLVVLSPFLANSSSHPSSEQLLAAAMGLARCCFPIRRRVRFVIHSTHQPPHEQLLVRLGAGGVLWCCWWWFLIVGSGLGVSRDMEVRRAWMGSLLGGYPTSWVFRHPSPPS
jgi:hypothetical protein